MPSSRSWPPETGSDAIVVFRAGGSVCGAEDVAPWAKAGDEQKFKMKRTMIEESAIRRKYIMHVIVAEAFREGKFYYERRSGEDQLVF